PIPCYRLFEAADHNYLFVACGNSTFWNKFAIALERPELVSDQRFENAPWGIPAAHWQTLKDIIEPIIRSRPRNEWLALLRDLDITCAPVLTRQEFAAQPQVGAVDMLPRLSDPVLGLMTQSGIPVELHSTPGALQGPAPISEPLDNHQFPKSIPSKTALL